MQRRVKTQRAAAALKTSGSHQGAERKKTLASAESLGSSDCTARILACFISNQHLGPKKTEREEKTRAGGCNSVLHRRPSTRRDGLTANDAQPETSRYGMSPSKKKKKKVVVFALRSPASALSRRPPSPIIRGGRRAAFHALPGSATRVWRQEAVGGGARMHAEFPVRSRWCVHTGWHLSTSSFKWRSSAVMALAEMPVSRSRRLCKRPGSFSERHHRSSPPNQQNPSKRLHFSRWDTQLEVGGLCRMRSLS